MKKRSGFLVGMAILTVSFVFWFSSAAYSGEPYVKTIYKNKNWQVIESGFKGEFTNRVVDSSPHYLDRGKNPKYGATIIRVTQTGKIVFIGENIGAFFKISKKTMLQVDDDTPLMIDPERPIDAAKTIKAMTKGKEVKVSIDFGPQGDVSVHVFNLSGFAQAYKKMMAGS